MKETPDTIVPVLVEPLPGHTTDEVVDKLKDVLAEQISVLSPSFVSARLLQSNFEKVQEIATIHRKVLKQTR